MIAPQPALDLNPETQVATQSTWTVDRTGARGSAGAVAAKSPQAAEAAADVLRRGGNAIDAAVVCAFVSGVAEPWMNGIGGGGYMVVHHAATNQTVAIDYPMVSPQGATADMFPLAGSGTDRALFGWPAVVDNANIVGPRATAVPGTVAGLALALERFGTLSLAQALEPAIALAEEGVPVTWHWTFVTVGGGTGGTTSTQALRILAPIPRSGVTSRAQRQPGVTARR